METKKLFNQVIDKFPAISYFKLWKTTDSFKLIAWEYRKIYVSDLTEDQVSNLMCLEKLSACYEEIQSPNDVVDVFSFENKCYVVDNQCWISELVREALQESEWDDDLFDESPKKTIKSVLKKKFQIYDGLLLAACLVPEGIACLINTHSSIDVKIINISSFKKVNDFTIRNTPLLIKFQQVCLILHVTKEKIETSYVRNWFPQVTIDRFDSGLLIVSLPEGLICGVLLDEHRLIPHFIFDWPFQALRCHWFCTNSKETNRIKKKSNLIFVFDGGTVVNLSQYGGQTIHLPLNKIRNSLITSEHIIVTDHSDCCTIKVLEHEEIIYLPLKGVLGFCEVPGQENIILVSTKHRTLYALNLKAKVERDAFKLPDVGLFDELLKKNTYLEQIANEIHNRDAYINALSFAINSSILRFTLSVHVVLRFLHTFRIRIVNENPGIVFREEIWKLFITLTTNGHCLTFVRDLNQQLTCESPYVDFITAECRGSHWDVCFDATLVTHIGDDKYRPAVPVGQVLLDISNFIQPISSMKIYQSHSASEFNLVEILENISSSFISNRNKTEKYDKLFSLEVPFNDDLNNDVIVRKILVNCRAHWRLKELDDICSLNKFEVFIAGHVVSIEINKDKLRITGKDAAVSHSLKVAAVTLLRDDFKMNINNQLKLKTEEMLKSLELLQYNTSKTVPVNLNKTLHLYKEIKQQLVYPMTSINIDFNVESNENKISTES